MKPTQENLRIAHQPGVGENEKIDELTNCEEVSALDDPISKLGDLRQQVTNLFISSEGREVVPANLMLKQRLIKEEAGETWHLTLFLFEPEKKNNRMNTRDWGEEPEYVPKYSPQLGARWVFTGREAQRRSFVEFVKESDLRESKHPSKAELIKIQRSKATLLLLEESVEAYKSASSTESDAEAA